MEHVVSTGKDDFYRQMFRLTLPIIVQNLLSAAVNSADVIMLNYVGQSAISAVSLAASYSNILFMVYYGLDTGASLLCAQYFGQNNLQAIDAIEGIALRFSIAISGIVALIAFTMPNRMMLIFTSDPELISIGSSYLRIMGITYLCWGVTEIYLAILRSIGRVTISMAVNYLKYILSPCGYLLRNTQGKVFSTSNQFASLLSVLHLSPLMTNKPLEAFVLNSKDSGA